MDKRKTTETINQETSPTLIETVTSYHPQIARLYWVAASMLTCYDVISDHMLIFNIPLALIKNAEC